MQITRVHEDLASGFSDQINERENIQEPMGSDYMLHSNKYVDFTFKNFNNKAALAAVINA